MSLVIFTAVGLGLFGFESPEIDKILDLIVPVKVPIDINWQSGLVAAWVESVRQICRNYLS